MRVEKKGLLFLAAYVVGGVTVAATTSQFMSGAAWAAVFFGWFAVFGVAQFFVVRCPHCGKSPFITPSGFSTPLAGKKCRYCHRDY
jgi:hypothetical protein